MGKLAFVFSGQGAQAPGMGSALCEAYPAAKAVFEAADALRPGTSEQCFHGSAEELTITKNTQPCLFAMELAAAAVLTSSGIRADCAAGFSLGELSALCYAGAADFSTLFPPVCRRGELMQRDAEASPTAMVAALKLTNEEVEAIAARFQNVYPVNYNCPGQVSVSGAASEIPAFAAAVKEAGGRTVPIAVAGAFHSPFMAAAGEDFALALQKVGFRSPALPVYANYTGAPYGTEVLPTLREQMCHPVRWEKSIRAMKDAGVDTFVELGPGRTLCGLIAKISREVRCFPLSTPEEAETVIREVGTC